LLQLVRLIKNYGTPALLVLLLVSTREFNFFICFITFEVPGTVEYLLDCQLWRQLYQIEHSHQTILLFAVVNVCQLKCLTPVILVSLQDYH
jgi:hypothetical protein